MKNKQKPHTDCLTTLNFRAENKFFYSKTQQLNNSRKWSELISAAATKLIIGRLVAWQFKRTNPQNHKEVRFGHRQLKYTVLITRFSSMVSLRFLKSKDF